MKKIITPEQAKVLQRIQNSIPKEWTDNITKKVMLAPLQAKLMRDLAEGKNNKDIDMDKVTPEMKEYATMIVDSGQINELEKMVDVENKEITSKIDEFVNSEIEKAAARGELPKGKKFRNLNKKIKNGINKK